MTDKPDEPEEPLPPPRDEPAEEFAPPQEEESKARSPAEPEPIQLEPPSSPEPPEEAMSAREQELDSSSFEDSEEPQVEHSALPPAYAEAAPPEPPPPLPPPEPPPVRATTQPSGMSERPPRAAPPRLSEPPPPPPRPFDAPRRPLPWIPILIVVAVAAALALGFFAFQSLTGDAVDESAYVVEPYAPTTELITARDRVEARAEPDTSSRIVVIFGDGVTLNVSGRVSRGLGNDWYAVSWNNQTAFVRAQDVTPGSGAPPAPIVRERPPPEEEKEEERPDELAEEEEQVAEAPRPSGALGVGDVNWVREPSARDFARFFPDEALDAGQSGNVTLSCIIGGSGRLACSVASESPSGYGFGNAAIGISRQLRVRTTLPDGSSAEGREMRLPLSFRAG